MLKREIFRRDRRPKGKGHFFFDSGEYDPKSDESQDFRFAFGGVDRVDLEVDFSQDTVRVWFQDRYEWHPFYPFYPFVGPTHDFPQSGDVRRPTNSLHAAMVEMKTKGAADFCMKGRAEGGPQALPGVAGVGRGLPPQIGLVPLVERPLLGANRPGGQFRRSARGGGRSAGPTRR
jgi:hypothetical protein